MSKIRSSEAREIAAYLAHINATTRGGIAEELIQKVQSDYRYYQHKEDPVILGIAQKDNYPIFPQSSAGPQLITLLRTGQAVRNHQVALLRRFQITA